MLTGYVGLHDAFVTKKINRVLNPMKALCEYWSQRLFDHKKLFKSCIHLGSAKIFLTTILTRKLKINLIFLNKGSAFSKSMI